MRCAEFEERAALWLSRELEEPATAEMDAHRSGCTECAAFLERCQEIDDRVRLAVLNERVDGRPVVARALAAVRRQNAVRWMAVAAGVILLLGSLAVVARVRAIPAGWASAAKDHRAEVVLAGPRRWRESEAEIAGLLLKFGVNAEDLRAIPAGFALARAKQCGIAGEPTLHLVFTDGTRSVSVYLRKGFQTGGARQLGDISVAGFARRGVTGVVAASDAGLCDEVARRLTAL